MGLAVMQSCTNMIVFPSFGLAGYHRLCLKRSRPGSERSLPWDTPGRFAAHMHPFPLRFASGTSCVQCGVGVAPAGFSDKNYIIPDRTWAGSGIEMARKPA